jgi:hypothetical protein
MTLKAILCSILLLTLTSCEEKNPATTFVSAVKENTHDSHIDDKRDQPIKVEGRLSFKDVNEIIEESHSSWINMTDGGPSLALHFMYKDTLAVCYSPECWLMYPYKREENRIVVLWDDIIDTKYPFDIVKAAGEIPKSYIGKPFMILELTNDTTLHANYPIRSLIKELNNSNKERIIFPDNYHLAKDGDFF